MSNEPTDFEKEISDTIIAVESLCAYLKKEFIADNEAGFKAPSRKLLLYDFATTFRKNIELVYGSSRYERIASQI